VIEIQRRKKILNGQNREYIFLIFKKIITRDSRFFKTEKKYGFIIYDNGEIEPKYHMGQNGHHKEAKKTYKKLVDMNKKDRLSYIDNLIESNDSIKKFKL